jgi:hypothetical protein
MSIELDQEQKVMGMSVQAHESENQYFVTKVHFETSQDGISWIPVENGKIFDTNI